MIICQNPQNVLEDKLKRLRKKYDGKAVARRHINLVRR